MVLERVLNWPICCILACREASKFYNKTLQYHINLISITTRGELFFLNKNKLLKNIEAEIARKIRAI